MCTSNSQPNTRPRRVTKALLSAALLLSVLPAWSETHLIVSFANEYQGQTPKWIWLYDPRQPGPEELAARIARKNFHLPIDTNPTLLTFKQGQYRLHHLNFNTSKKGSKNALSFPKSFKMRFKKDRVYYLGDLTFTEDSMLLSSSTKKLKALCKQYPVLQEAEAIYLVFNKPEPIRLKSPCQPKLIKTQNE